MLSFFRSFCCRSRPSKNESNNPYQLSMPMLATAMTGDASITNNSVDSFIKQVEEMKEKPNFKAWLLGRLLLALQAVGDQQNKILLVLKKITENLQVQDQESLFFYAWAQGYVAVYHAKAAEKSLATSIVTELMNLLTNLEKIYDEDNNKKCDLLWAYAMTMMAIDANQDKSQYDLLLVKIKAKFNCDNLTTLLYKNLKPKGDFKAWLLSIFYNAAITFSDTANSDGLRPHLYSEDYTKDYTDDDRMMADANLAHHNNLPPISPKRN